MGERFSRPEQLEHRVPMLLGIFSTKGVLPLEFKPAYSVGDQLTLHLDEVEQETDSLGLLIANAKALCHSWSAQAIAS
jgi:hypothetical protein